MNNATGGEAGGGLAKALLVPCASRKSVRPATSACAVSLTKAQQPDIETAWLDRLHKLPVQRPAGALYSGRGFHLARQAAAASGGTLYAISAGLGLVAAEQVVPAYGLTIVGRGPESVSARVVGRFDPTAWWCAISSGPFATSLLSLFKPEDDRPVLVALTQPYARMFATALDSLPDIAIARLRIVGVNLTSLLPGRLASQTLPYDERLQAVLPGTRADFPHRAIAHFATNGLGAQPGADVAEHRRWVEAALAGRIAPVLPQRPRLSDEDIMLLIERHLPETKAIGRLLRLIRDREHVACEQARFTRLYRATIERRAA
ncbi:hypothetical protein J2849_002383 [Azospirillum melinis]|nr:hypothetical protein [Azospirillum melinis]